VKTGGWPFALPRAQYIQVAASTSLSGDFLSCSLRVSRRLPLCPASYWFDAPVLRFIRFTVFCTRAQPLLRRLRNLPQTWFCFRVLPGIPASQKVMPALTRFSCPFDVTRPFRATIPGFSNTRVMLRPSTYHAVRRLAPETTSLVSFNQARPWGSVPFRACPYGNHR